MRVDAVSSAERRPVLDEVVPPRPVLDDPIAARWLSAWVLLRDRRVDRVGGWPLVHVETASRRTELMCDSPDVDTFTTLVRHVAGDPTAMLTVVGDDLYAHRSVRLPAGAEVSRDDETLMTTALAPTGRSGPRAAEPLGLLATCEADGPRHVHRLEGAGRVAAEATMALEQDWVVFDGVETTPAFRRQGLGRHLISTMCAEAFDLGARHGVLAASADGRALYESLGWTVQRQLLSVIGSSS